MASRAWRALGRGSVLGTLRADVKRATREVLLVGPWIDDHVAAAVVEACAPAVALRVLTRPIESSSPGFASHAAAAAARFAGRANTEVRTLERLHAKVAVIDGRIGYVGSANWYRFSLEESFEVVVRAELDDLGGLADELASLWDQAERLEARAGRQPASPRATGIGYREEVVDPVAAAVLAQVPGAFVIGRRRGR